MTTLFAILCAICAILAGFKFILMCHYMLALADNNDKDKAQYLYDCCGIAQRDFMIAVMFGLGMFIGYNYGGA